MISPSSSSQDVRPIDIVKSCFDAIASETEVGHSAEKLTRLIAGIRDSGMEIIREIMEKDTEELGELNDLVCQLRNKVRALDEEKQELRRLLNEIETVTSQGSSLSAIECLICFRAYENSLLPETGECGHSICMDCVDRLHSKDCPICRDPESFRYSCRNYLAEELISRHQPGLSASATTTRINNRRRRRGFRLSLGNFCLVVILIMSFPICMLIVGLILIPLISFVLTVSVILYFTVPSEILVDYLTRFLDRLDATIQILSE